MVLYVLIVRMEQLLPRNIKSKLLQSLLFRMCLYIWALYCLRRELNNPLYDGTRHIVLNTSSQPPSQCDALHKDHTYDRPCPAAHKRYVYIFTDSIHGGKGISCDSQQ